MALTPFTSALLQRFAATGNDGGSTPTNNIRRTPSLFIGGHDFSITLLDSASVQAGTKFKLTTQILLIPIRLIMLLCLNS